ncbi:hypothetical protein L226DRAFT_65310 [Lentinus tigrinus ALCF2SS1-7]|uniref:uncharacterized protein n=1 Tax=Lentinus tigrinus ALCF2SS1-7 TaxID=1328758 RepID=UPI001165FB71|nr:hypothetical protein L226DRAFT_65310 [Lentinus tigrinus ALCF2SS1-7]
MPVNARRSYIRAALPGVCLVPPQARSRWIWSPGLVSSSRPSVLGRSRCAVDPPSTCELSADPVPVLPSADVGQQRTNGGRAQYEEHSGHAAENRYMSGPGRDDHSLARPEGSRRVGKLWPAWLRPSTSRAPCRLYRARGRCRSPAPSELSCRHDASAATTPGTSMPMHC